MHLVILLPSSLSCNSEHINIYCSLLLSDFSVHIHFTLISLSRLSPNHINQTLFFAFSFFGYFLDLCRDFQHTKGYSLLAILVVYATF